MNHYLNVFRKFADFDGRARRAEYWYFVLFNFLVAMTLMTVGSMIDLRVGMGLYTLYILAALIPAIAVAIRRMHDVGKSGWYVLIPLYNFILAVTPGDVGPNEYGPDPKGAGGGYQDTTLLDN